MEEDGIVFDFMLLELGIAEMKGEGERGYFAASDGAGEEIDGEQFHCYVVRGGARGEREAEKTIGFWMRRIRKTSPTPEYVGHAPLSAVSH